jgi:hypothetical protein
MVFSVVGSILVFSILFSFSILFYVYVFIILMVDLLSFNFIIHSKPF